MHCVLEKGLPTGSSDTGRWVLKEESTSIVTGTRFIEYGFHAKYYDGARNMDAYLDDAYLMVVPRPEKRHEIRIPEVTGEPPEGTDEDFTHWMDRQELQHRSQAWKPKGLWVTAVEGRWRDGAPQYRVREETRPLGRGFSWYWWYDLDEQAFARKCDELTENEFRLVHSFEFSRPDGSVRYQVVWAKSGD